MLKVLLIDDEILVITYLRSLISWKKCGYEIIGDANNGKIALDMIKKYSPDIIILDVSMPVMDGIAISIYIKSQKLNIQTIILSSYQDYEYMRETMKNGAIDYLLKHTLTSEKLLSALNTAKNIINKYQVNMVKGTVDEAYKYQRNNQDIHGYLMNLMLGISVDNYEKQKIAGSVSMKNISLIIMKISNYMFFYNKYTDQERYKLKQSILNIGNQMLDEIDQGYIMYLDKGRFAILISNNEYHGEAQILKEITFRMNTFIDAIHRYLNIHIFWVQSPLFFKLSDINKYYVKMSNLLDGKVEKEDNLSKTLEHENSIMPMLSISQEKQILSAIDNGNFNELDSIIYAIFDGLKLFSNDISKIQIITSDLITIATKVCNSFGVSLDSICIIENLTFASFDVVKSWIALLYVNLTNVIKKKQDASNNSKYVNDTIEYIQRNYKNEISLTKVAEHIGISYSYLSHIFKEETKESFVDYVNTVRIQMALKYIKEDHDKINSIYKKVGFNNYNYFFQVFKKIMRMTPNSYLKNTK